MISKSVLNLCAAILIAGGVSAPAAAQSADLSGRVQLVHRPMVPHFNPDGTYKRQNGEFESGNWAGYAVTAKAP
jgi:hypothetical protein